MKKHFTVILLFLNIFGYTQTIMSFSDPDSQWNEAKTFPNGNPQNPYFIETTTKVYGFGGDTIINSDVWLKMYYTSDSSFLNDLVFIGAVKEVNGLVLFNDTLSNTDTIYNFNLVVGDSVLYSFYGSASEYLKIYLIDSTEIDGIFHKRFHFSEPTFEPFHLDEFWIEGIGSIHGPLFTQYPVLFSQELPADSIQLTCYKSGNNIVWNNPSYDSCYLNIVLSKHEAIPLSLHIYPNPASTHISLSNPYHSLQLYSLYGNLVLSSSTGEKTISFEGVTPGVYIATVMNNEKIISREKLIIK